jgi:hypothetical protein
MRNPQVVNNLVDTVITVNADDVINDISQVKISAASIQVDITLLDTTTNTSSAVTNKTMTYNASLDVYTINISDLTAIINDRRTYVGRIIENGVAYGMRPLKLSTFCTDIDSFEDTWMRLPYRVNIGGGQAWLEWSRNNFSTIVFKAPAYEGGTGTTYATLPERVTHRGAIVPV